MLACADASAISILPPHRFAKLAVFNLTRFDRVVYLDADTLALPPGADDLFGCRAALCAALRHSERFNSGVMVLTPNAATAANMSRLITVLPSYTGCAPPAEQVASLFFAAKGRQHALQEVQSAFHQLALTHFPCLLRAAATRAS